MKASLNFDPMVEIKQQPDHDWLAGLEMKWVLGTNESAETKERLIKERLRSK